MGTLSNVFCSRCREKIVGTKYPIKGHTYCYKCFKELQQEHAGQEDRKQALFAYVRELFSVPDLPSEVVSAIEREIDSGKKPQGIEYTLHYYYIIEGHQTSNVSNVGFIIRDQYEAARQYAAQMKELQAKNAVAEIEAPPITVKINPAKLPNRKTGINYNIEDL